MDKKLIICILFIFLFSCSSLGKRESETEEGEYTVSVSSDKIVEVDIVKLEYIDFHYELLANGTIAPARKADLRFKTQEEIVKIYVKNGDWVSKGQKIASQDPFRLENAFIQAKDVLDRTLLDLQDILIGQGYSLNDSNNIPKDILDLAKIKSNYNQNIVNLNAAEYNYKNTVLYAPFSGIVANLFTKEHNTSNSADPFCTIIDMTRPEVEFMVLENELSQINTGDQVQISTFFANEFLETGLITQINPIVEKNGMVKVKATLTNARNQNTRFYDGMNVKIKIQRVLGKKLIVPKEALVLRSNKKVVFIYKDGLAHWVYVETGPENSTSYVITDGLKEGDWVIYDGNEYLAHQAPVRLKNQEKR